MVVELTGDGLGIEGVVRVARGGERVAIDGETLERVAAARADLEGRIAEGERIYGVNTGFGALADERIDPEDVETLQLNLIRSHAVGVGDPLAADEVRAMVLLRLNSLLNARSGIRPVVVETLREILNEGVYPRVPRKGSASASGDLAPLAHVALVLVGEGEAFRDGDRVPGGEALSAAGIDPITPKAKEGLALVNGTNLVAGLGALAVHDARILAETADTVGAMSLEASAGIADAFRAQVHEARGQPGQETSAARVRAMVAGSELVRPAAESREVQDAYSLRCLPQVHGATRDVIDHVASVVEREINAVTDNPLVLAGGDVVSGGNFHGQPVALALDSLATAVAELADVAERRVFSLLTGDDERPVEDHFEAAARAVAAGEATPEEALADMTDRLEAVAAGDRSVEDALSDFRRSVYGDDALPRFLVEAADPGLNSGLMIPQVTAAALVSENRTLAHPDSADSVPTSDNQEDHVSMGANAANHLLEVVENTTTVLAVEALAARQALAIRDRDPGEGTRAVVDRLDDHVRSTVDRPDDRQDWTEGHLPVEGDRYLLDDLAALVDLVERGAFDRSPGDRPGEGRPAKD